MLQLLWFLFWRHFFWNTLYIKKNRKYRIFSIFSKISRYFPTLNINTLRTCLLTYLLHHWVSAVISTQIVSSHFQTSVAKINTKQVILALWVIRRGHCEASILALQVYLKPVFRPYVARGLIKRMFIVTWTTNTAAKPSRSSRTSTSSRTHRRWYMSGMRSTARLFWTTRNHKDNATLLYNITYGRQYIYFNSVCTITSCSMEQKCNNY